jgi:hypothetical protein
MQKTDVAHGATPRRTSHRSGAFADVTSSEFAVVTSSEFAHVTSSEFAHVTSSAFADVTSIESLCYLKGTL